jgi:DNA invertase Pin-like site-specific DNA recombinase
VPRRRHAGRHQFDRLARSLPDARAIAEKLTHREVTLDLGGSVHDPTDPVGRLMFSVLAMVPEFESDLIRMRTREGMKVAKAKGRLRGSSPNSTPRRRRISSRCTAPASTRSASARRSSRHTVDDLPPRIAAGGRTAVAAAGDRATQAASLERHLAPGDTDPSTGP